MVLFVLHRFQILITKFNFKTPGREDKAAAQQVEATEEHKLLLLVWEAKITLKSLTVVQRDYASHFIKMTKSIKYYSKVLVPKV